MSKLYLSGKLLQPKCNSFPIPYEVNTAKDLQYVASISDYTFSEFKCGYATKDIDKKYLIQSHRCIKDFVSSCWLWADIDHSTSIDEAMTFLKGIEYFITTSKSHDKNGIHKFHILFPLHKSITDGDELKALLKALLIFLKDIHPDSSCFEVSRLFQGNTNNESFYNEGDNILSHLTVEEKIEEKPVYKATNNTKLYKYLKRLSEKHGRFSTYDDIMKLGFAMKNSGFELDDYLALIPPVRHDQGIHIWESENNGSLTVGTLIFWARSIGYTLDT